MFVKITDTRHNDTTNININQITFYHKEALVVKLSSGDIFHTDSVSIMRIEDAIRESNRIFEDISRKLDWLIR